MNKIDDKQFQLLKKNIENGKSKFLLKTGLPWGVLMFFMMTFILNPKPENGFTSSIILMNLIIWAVTGFVFGYTLWKMNIRSYEKVLNDRKTTEQDNSTKV